MLLKATLFGRLAAAGGRNSFRWFQWINFQVNENELNFIYLNSFLGEFHKFHSLKKGKPAIIKALRYFNVSKFHEMIFIAVRSEWPTRCINRIFSRKILSSESRISKPFGSWQALVFQQLISYLSFNGFPPIQPSNCGNWCTGTEVQLE